MNTTRRSLLKAFALAPAGMLGRAAANDQIQVAQIGCGRIAHESEFPGILKHPGQARYVAVCDLDSVRAADAKALIERRYASQVGRDRYTAVKVYRDYREMLADKSIDAVAISTPDHWHAQPAIEAALAGKDIYLQKPASLTIVEGRQVADTIRNTGRILQLGSQQRSAANFRLACELVRNGRIGRIRKILIGLPIDPPGGSQKEMPVPANLDYDMWLGSTPKVYYTEDRVHPQADTHKARYGRPGWLRCEQFGAGMITGWGAHHIDIAHWAMGLEHSGPVAAQANARFATKGLWDVHGAYHVRFRYANGVNLHISDAFDNGIEFIGETGWIWVTRGNVLTASDPRMIAAGIRENEIHLHASPEEDHHLDWLASIRSRRPPVAPAEDGHRSCTGCLIAHTAMRLGREIKWDPQRERFGDDEEANKLLSRPQRAPYGTDSVLARHART